MVLTQRGEELMYHFRQIIAQVEELEQTCKGVHSRKRQFSISVPRASYIAEALVNFSKLIGDEPVTIYYKETNPYRAIENILEEDYGLGIIRYAANYDKYFTKVLEEKNMVCKPVVQFHYKIITSSKSPLAKKDVIHFSDLYPFIEIAHADPFVPSLPFSVVKKEELPDDFKRRIFVFERGTQFDLLNKNTETFMWVSPMPKEILERHGLVQCECLDNTKMYKDMLIYDKNYKLSDLDMKFITEIKKSIHENF